MTLRLSLRNVCKTFDSLEAVRDMTLSIEPGEIFALIGPNGSGKTTTVKMIAGLYAPTSGAIEIEGKSIRTSPQEAKRAFGYIPDEPFVYERMSGREFLHLVGVLYDMPKGARDARIAELVPIFPHVPIDDFVDHYSRGNKQKLSILAALLHEPKLLLVDEPIVGLDPESIVRVKSLFSDFASRGGTVFVCTHTLSFAESIADRVGILENGALKETGTLEQLREKLATKKRATLEDVYMAATAAS